MSRSTPAARSRTRSGRARSTRARVARIGAVFAAATMALAACSLSEAEGDGGGLGESGESASDGDSAGAINSITVVTHDSFNPSEGVLQAFTDESGIEVTLVAPGDGGALVNQLVLTKDSPLGDVVYGVDNTFASRAIEEGVFAPYTAPGLPAGTDEYLIGDSLTPIDVSDVCLNVDTAWYEANGQTPPATLDDLLKPEYAGQTVVTNPATSSPGLAFLLTTISAYGPDGWHGYWESLVENDVLVVEGWSDAYYVDFTGGGGDGARPVVLSYASSPPYTVSEETGEPTTAALLDTCFRQVEYAGVLAGAENPVGAEAFVDFLLSDTFQSDLPEAMYVYPINSSTDLPAEWAQWAPLAREPHEVPAEEIAQNRAEWIDQWAAIVSE